MKHPQTLAKELNLMFPNAELKLLGDNACCAFVLLWCLGLEPDDIDAIKIVFDLKKEGALDKEYSVIWAVSIYRLTGRTLEFFDKKKITSIKSIRKRTPVLFTTTYTDENGVEKKKGHWVGVENGKIGFNPLERSVCVEQGKPAEMRVLKIKGIN